MKTIIFTVLIPGIILFLALNLVARELFRRYHEMKKQAEREAALAERQIAGEACRVREEIAAVAEPLEVVSGLEVPVARVGHLLALKILAAREARPQDVGDARQLLRVASAEETEPTRRRRSPRTG